MHLVICETPEHEESDAESDAEADAESDAEADAEYKF